MGKACSMHGRNDMHTVFWLENLKGRDHSEDLNVDRRIILEWIIGKLQWEGVDYMHLTWDRDQWQALANTVMNLQGISWLVDYYLQVIQYHHCMEKWELQSSHENVLVCSKLAWNFVQNLRKEMQDLRFSWQ
jgi:hypothetical protein